MKKLLIILSACFITIGIMQICFNKINARTKEFTGVEDYEEKRGTSIHIYDPAEEEPEGTPIDSDGENDSDEFIIMSSDVAEEETDKKKLWWADNKGFVYKTPEEPNKALNDDGSIFWIDSGSDTWALSTIGADYNIYFELPDGRRFAMTEILTMIRSVNPEMVDMIYERIKKEDE